MLITDEEPAEELSEEPPLEDEPPDEPPEDDPPDELALDDYRRLPVALLLLWQAAGATEANRPMAIVRH